MTDFTTIIANDLPEVQMIAGDERVFVYSVYDEFGGPISIASSIPYVSIFKYGDPSYSFALISGSIILGGADNKFSIHFSGLGLSGVYQQQVIIEDSDGNVHVPSQGKIVVFPSNFNLP